MTEFMDYERCSDTIMYLTNEITLEFITNLAKKNKFGERQFFSTEIEYNSERYSGSPVKSIRRNLTYYFVINIKDNFGGGLIIRPQDQILLTLFLEKKVIPWIMDGNTFQVVNGNLAIKQFEPATYAQSEVKYITFEPVIIIDDDAKQTPAIKFNLNGVTTFELNADKFMGFYSIIKNTDMYLASCAQINYTKIPPYDLNVYKPVGLGASKDPNNDAWSNINYKGRGYNSFLDNK